MKKTKAYSVKAKVNVQGKYQGFLGEAYSDTRDKLSKLNGEIFVFQAPTKSVINTKERGLISQEMETELHKLTNEPQNCISNLDVEILATNEQM